MTTARTRSIDRVRTGLGIAAFVMVALLGPFGAATPPARAHPNDDRFLAALQSQGIIYESAAAAIAAGHLVCTELDQGETKSQVAQDVINNSDLDAFHAGYFVGAFVGAYCSYYSSHG